MSLIVTQKDFCKAAGITHISCKQLRDLGYIPAYGANPVKIPMQIGLEGVEQYAIDCSMDQVGKNAKYKSQR